MHCNGVFKGRKLATQAVVKMIGSMRQKSYIDFDNVEAKEGEEVNLILVDKETNA